MSLIAHAAGVGVGSLYKHFASQADLFAAIYDRTVSRELVVLREVLGRSDVPPLQRLSMGVRQFCDRSLRAGSLAYALMVEPAGSVVDEHRLRLREAFRTAIADLIDEAVREGAVRPHLVGTSSAAVLGVMSEALVRPLSGDPPDGDTQQYIDLIAAMALGAVRATS